MNLQELSSKLKVIGQNFNAVNSGGCGSVAGMIAIALKDKFEDMRITSCSTWDDAEPNIDDVREMISDNMTTQEWRNNGVRFSHVWVEVYHEGKWYTLDADGVMTTEDMYEHWAEPYEGSFTVDEVLAMSNDGSWNPKFKRNQLPAIQEYINHNIH